MNTVLSVSWVLKKGVHEPKAAVDKNAARVAGIFTVAILYVVRPCFKQRKDNKPEAAQTSEGGTSNFQPHLRVDELVQHSTSLLQHLPGRISRGEERSGNNIRSSTARASRLRPNISAVSSSSHLGRGGMSNLGYFTVVSAMPVPRQAL